MHRNTTQYGVKEEESVRLNKINKLKICNKSWNIVNRCTEHKKEKCKYELSGEVE